MQAFFSGTDTNTLYSEGKDRNNFVSLIVNNAREYCAAITYKEVHTIHRDIDTHIPFFNLDAISRRSQDTQESIEIHYCMLNVIHETPAEVDNDLLTRIKKLKEEKQSESRFHLGEDRDFPWGGGREHQEYLKRAQELTSTRQATLFDKPEFETPAFEAPEDTDYEGSDIKVSRELLHATVAQLVSGSVTATKLPSDNFEKTIKSISERWEARLHNSNAPDSLIEDYVANILSDNALTLGEEYEQESDNIYSEEVYRSILCNAVFDELSKPAYKSLSIIEDLLNNVEAYV